MLCWNTYCSNFNTREIEVYNIFNHHGFYSECVKAKKKFKDDKEGFAEEVRGSLCYYFWSKCEYETILTHWPSCEYYDMRTDMKLGELNKALNDAGIKFEHRNRPWINDGSDITIHVYPNPYRDHDLKIDVYQQVMNNWDIFIDWLWEHRKELKARK